MINPDGPYFKQVQLLCRLLPFFQEHENFALKGGSAINLFIRDMPRISVDLDFTFVPVSDRTSSLKSMTEIYRGVGRRITHRFKDCRLFISPFDSQGNVNKITISQGDALVTMESSPVLRGTLFKCVKREITPRARAIFGFVTAWTCSLPDVYAGKICACLDRQHPRDLFDVKGLLDNEGLEEYIRKAFVVYLVSHSRPISELLDPPALENAAVFEEEFLGMTDSDITYQELVKTRERLVQAIRKALTGEERGFIQSVAEGKPEWNLSPIKDVETFPALRWKIINVLKMTEEKRNRETGRIKDLLKLG